MRRIIKMENVGRVSEIDIYTKPVSKVKLCGGDVVISTRESKEIPIGVYGLVKKIYYVLKKERWYEVWETTPDFKKVREVYFA